MEATRASSTSEAPKTHTTHSGDAHQPRSHRHALLRGEARCNEPIAEDPREALVAAKGRPGVKAVEPVEAAATRCGAHGGKGTPLQVLHWPEGAAAPSGRDDRSHHASRGANGQTRNDSAGNGDAERGAEAATPQERVLRPMKVLEADAVGVVERSRTAAVHDSLKVAAGDRRNGAERRGSERDDVRPSSLRRPRAPVLAAFARGNAGEERVVGAEGVAQRGAGVADDDVEPSEPAVIAEDEMIRALTARCDAGDMQPRLLRGTNTMRGDEGTPGTDPEVMAARQREDVARLVAAEEDVEAHVGVERPTG